MAKNAFFSEETMKVVDQLVTTEHGQTVIDYGKGNFLLGGFTALAFGAAGFVVYKTIELGGLVVKYLKS